MTWRERLRREGIVLRIPEFDHVLHASLAPAFPPEYDVPGLVAVTFRLTERPSGGHVFVTALDVAAALRLGERLGLDDGEALAMVDSHERMHVWLQLAGIGEAEEEDASRFVDAVWLSLRHPRVAEKVAAGEFGLVTRVGPDFWEALVDTEADR